MTDAVTVPQPASFSSLLRGATRIEQERFETVLRLPERLRSEADLARLLIAWDTVWAEIRVGVQRDRRPAGHDERARLLVSAVRAIQRIRTDLTELGVGTAWTDDSDDPSAHVPGDLAVLLSSEPGVWALSYVLRGSRLAGDAVAHLISDRLELPFGAAATYHCDEAAEPSWVLFLRRMDAWGRGAGDPDRDQAVSAARTAFSLVGARLEAALPAGDGVPHGM